MATAQPFFLDDQQLPPDEQPSPAATDNALNLAPLSVKIRMSGEKKERFTKRVCEEIDAYGQATEPRQENLKLWRRSWEMSRSGVNGPWDGSSDLTSHLTRIYCNSHQARLTGQITGPQPPFTCVARKPAAIDAAPAVEEALGSVLETADWAAKADELHAELVIAGNCIWRTTHETRYARIPKRKVDWDEDEGHALMLAGMDPADALFAGVKSLSFEFDTQTIHHGVEFKIIPFEDSVIWPLTCGDPEHAYLIGERVRLRGSDLKEGVKKGLYDREAVDKLLDMESDDVPEEQQERWDDQGIEPAPYEVRGWNDEDYKEFLCHEVNYKGDFDGDGLQEWAILTIHTPTRTLLRAHYDDYEHGRGRYTWFRYITRVRQLMGMGIPELIAVIQDADEGIANAIADMTDLHIASWNSFFYNYTAGLDLDRNKLKLGRPVGVEDINGIKDREVKELPQSVFLLRDQYKTQAELLTASSNPAMGRTTDADKTLGEVQIALSAANQIFEEHAKRLSWTHAKVWDAVRWLYAQFADPEEDGKIRYRRTAAPDIVDFPGITPEMLTSDLDLVPAGLEQLSDMQTRIQVAMMVYSQNYEEAAVAQNYEAMEIMKDGLLMAVRYPQRKKLMAAFKKQWQAQQAVMQMEMMMGGGAPQPGALGQPGAAPGAPEPQGPGGPAIQPPEAPPEGAAAERPALEATSPQEMPGRTSPLVQ